MVGYGESECCGFSHRHDEVNLSVDRVYGAYNWTSLFPFPFDDEPRALGEVKFSSREMKKMLPSLGDVLETFNEIVDRCICIG